MKNLGNVVALLRSETAPTKTYVMWAKILDPQFPNTVELNFYDGAQWKPISSTLYYLDPVISVLDEPTGGEALAERYLVSPNPTGGSDFENQANNIAQKVAGGWSFTNARRDSVLFVRSSQEIIYRTETGWDTVGSGKTRRDILVTVPWSNYPNGHVIPEGTTLTDLVAGAVEVAIPPSVAQPSANLSISPSSTQEVGEEVVVSLNGIFNQGDAGNKNGDELYRVGSPDVLVSSNEDDTDTVIGAQGSIGWYYRASYDQQPDIPTDQLGNEYPNLRIPSGTKQSSVRSISFIFPYFYGLTNGTDPSTLDLYAEGTKVLATGNGTLTIPFPEESPRRLWFAIHNSISLKTAWADPSNPLNNGAIGSPSDLFGAPVVKVVTSIGQAQNWTENYNLYFTELTQARTLKIS